MECDYLGFESAPCSDSDKDIVQHMSAKVTHKELIHYIKNNGCCALCSAWSIYCYSYFFKIDIEIECCIITLDRK